MSILLSDGDVSQLVNYANDLPTKFGATLLSWLKELSDQQNKPPVNENIEGRGQGKGVPVPDFVNESKPEETPA